MWRDPVDFGSLELRPFLSVRWAPGSGEVGGGGKNVELALAAVSTSNRATARGELAQALAEGGFPSCVFVFPGLAGKQNRLETLAKSRAEAEKKSR